eukprot:TRINITY_DN25942_c0_g1_i1.p1 TRINITY_DN25942_c0_g1~~TRINITY_DN25942_c0_g1_i1.p1  ORF type:complete len:102 (-),score=2.45 TRINITY_DN25942_c0_g1_i1:95-400(-)
MLTSKLRIPFSNDLFAKSRSYTFLPRRGYVSNTPPWNVLFFGSDDVSVEALKALRRNQVDAASTGFRVWCPTSRSSFVIPLTARCGPTQPNNDSSGTRRIG